MHVNVSLRLTGLSVSLLLTTGGCVGCHRSYPAFWDYWYILYLQSH